MIAIAKELQAKVQGDDGEVYLSSTEIEREEVQPTNPASPPRFSAPWPFWKQLALAFLLGCVLLALKLLLFK